MRCSIWFMLCLLLFLCPRALCGCIKMAFCLIRPIIIFIRALTRSCIRSFIVGFFFSARFTFNILTSGFIVIPWTKTVKYITAIVVVTNIGCFATLCCLINSANANATAPRRPIMQMRGREREQTVNIRVRNWCFMCAINWTRGMCKMFSTIFLALKINCLWREGFFSIHDGCVSAFQAQPWRIMLVN